MRSFPSLNSSLAAPTTCRYCQLDALETPVASSAAGFVVPSVGAMVEGWLISFPRRHVLSLSELEADEWDSFADLLVEVRKQVEEVYGPTVMFEHGSGGVGRLAACGVDHAHMHVVPLEIDLRGAIAACETTLGRYEWESVGDRVRWVADSDYLFVHDATGAWLSRNAWLPSQVVRRAIAAHLGIEQWDWKAAPHTEIVEATRHRLITAA